MPCLISTAQLESRSKGEGADSFSSITPLICLFSNGSESVLRRFLMTAANFRYVEYKMQRQTAAILKVPSNRFVIPGTASKSMQFPHSVISSIPNAYTSIPL